MFKLVVLSALLALACAKPSLTYSSLVAPAVYAAPTAVSHQSRVDVHSSPVIAYSGPVLKAIEVAAPAVYAAPHVYTQEVHAAPAVYSAPAVYAAPAVHSVPAVYSAPAVYAAPTAVSHQSRVDVHSSPVVAYSAPVISAPLISAPVLAHSAPLVSAYSNPIVSAYHGVGELALAPNTPAVVSKANGTPLETIEVVNARNAHYTAKALQAHGIHKRSLAYSPLLAPAVYAAPTAVSHQSRVDVHSSPIISYSPVVSAYSHPVLSAYSSPLISAHSAPLLSAYSTPVVAHSAPLVSAYSTPIVSAYHGLGELALAPNTPAVVSKANGVPLETIDVVNARNAHYTAKALQAHGIHKRSIAYSSLVAPAVYAAPTAVSHQSRVDVHSSPVVAYSAPVISAPVVSAYSHPLVSAYSHPLVSAYSSPLVSAYSSPLLKSYSPLVSSYSTSVVNSHAVPAYNIHY